MNGLVWFWPGVVVAVIVAVLLAAPVARALPSSRFVAWLVVASVGVILAATLTPIHGPVGIDITQVRACDFSRNGIAPIAELDSLTDVTLNIAVFVPLGLAIGLLPSSRGKALVLLGAVALPIFIEAIQYLIPTLARGCQSGDVIDNLCGLAIGLVVGSVVHVVVARR